MCFKMYKNIFGNELITIRNDNFFLDEISVKELCSKYKTPFFAFSKNKIEQNINQFNSALADVFRSYKINYSVKANYMNEILGIINKCNINFEIISNYEFKILKNNNFCTENMLIGGPYLQNELIESALNEKNPLFTLYNINDIKRIDNIAKKKGKKANILLRFIAPKKNSHLGINNNEKTIDEIVKCYSKLENIKIIGILSHYGTSINTFDKYELNAKYISEMAIKLEKRGVLEPKIFDFGGGFPIASSFNQKKLIKTFNIIKNVVEENGFNNISYHFEPGRYIVGDSGVCMMKIINIALDRSYFFVNAGNHILPRFAKNPIRFYDINKPLKNYNTPVHIYGIVLSDEDILVKNYNFSSYFSLGDIILAINCGAYSYTFSNRFPYEKPHSILIDGEKHNIIN